MRRFKFFIIAAVIVIVFVISIIPSLAASGYIDSVTIVITDNTIDGIENPPSVQYDVITSINADSVYLQFDIQSQLIKVFSMDFDTPTIIYSCILPYYYTADVLISAGDGNYINGKFQNSINGQQTSYHMNLTGQSSLRIEIGYLVDSNVYSMLDIDDAFRDGMKYASQHPEWYGYYTQVQYNDYGVREYNRGVSDSNGDFDDGYQAGLLDAKKSVGLANVAMTGIYQVFNNFINHTGIFGVSLASILVTAIIILIVFLIFKAVRS